MREHQLLREIKDCFANRPNADYCAFGPRSNRLGWTPAEREHLWTLYFPGDYFVFSGTPIPMHTDTRACAVHHAQLIELYEPAEKKS